MLDVARFKYPSYWVTLEDLFNSLTPIDNATGQPRGFSVLRKSSPVLSPNATPTTGLFSLNFNKQSWPIFLRDLRSGTSSSAPEDSITGLVKILHRTQVQPLQSRSISTQDIQAAKADQQLDPVPTKLMTDLYEAEVQALVNVLRPSRIWTLVDSALRQNPPPFPFDARYPQALPYVLFIQSLLTSVSAPAELRHAFHAAVQSHDLTIGKDAERVLKEIRFLQDQQASLEKCCSTEKECGCMGRGLPGVSCAV